MSSLKRFFQFALREGLRRDDPTRRPRVAEDPALAAEVALGGPRLKRCSRAPDVETAQGLRDRAMLETLYASGLRVSELVGLKTMQVSLDMGVVRVLGKGSKERLTPLGEEAVDWIAALPARPRGRSCSARSKSDALFVTTRGGPMTRQAFWALVKRHASKAGIRQRDLAAHAAPRVRHAPHQPRRRPARRCSCCSGTPDISTTQIYTHVARERLKAAAPQAPSARMIEILDDVSPWLFVVAPLVMIVAYTVFGLTRLRLDRHLGADPRALPARAVPRAAHGAPRPDSATILGHCRARARGGAGAEAPHPVHVRGLRGRRDSRS